VTVRELDIDRDDTRSERQEEPLLLGVTRRARHIDDEEFPMIVHFIDAMAGTPVYINPDYVVSLRPDPADPDTVSIIRLDDGELVRVRGSHQEIAGRLTRAAA
jgi:hypothetical protein